MQLRFYTILVLFFTLNPFSVYAQNGYIAINDIIIEGNKKTKKAIILREVPFSIGDSILITDLQNQLERSRLNVQNTGLFVKVETSIKDWNTLDHSVDISIKVHETWYWYPYIIFEFADRNFNVWWTEQNRSLKRVNYGISLTHLNLTGRRDRLKFTVQDGYTKKYELDYNIPGINKAQTIGVFGNIFFARRKEIAYITEDNKLLFATEGDNFLLRRFRIGGGLTYRPKLYEYHTVKALYSDNGIGSLISDELNPDYFYNDNNRQRHLTLQYEYTIDKRDIKPYPLNGYLATFLIQKDGVGITDDVNSLSLRAKLAKYHSFSPKMSLGFFIKGKTELLRTNKQPYTHVSALGYGEDFLRGYELYVIDGIDFGLVKTSLRYELFKREFNFGKYMPLEQFRLMPLRIYLSLNNDVGYVNAPEYDNYGFLNNKWLWGGGLGLDFVVYYDKVFQIQYSFNDLLEHGLFIHFKLSI